MNWTLNAIILNGTTRPNVYKIIIQPYYVIVILSTKCYWWYYTSPPIHITYIYSVIGSLDYTAHIYIPQVIYPELLLCLYLYYSLYNVRWVKCNLHFLFYVYVIIHERIENYLFMCVLILMFLRDRIIMDVISIILRERYLYEMGLFWTYRTIG